MKNKLFTAIAICLYIIVNIQFTGNNSIASDKDKIVYVFDLKQDIFPSAGRVVKNAFADAEEKKADIIVIQLNTYGGQLNVADEIHSTILNSKIPVYVLIEQNAASAGALISISCDSIYMKKGSTIGAASVVNQNGEVMPDKYQSYMRGMMRATAQQRGRDPKIAEGMVTPNGYLKDVADTGRIITLTSTEAIRYKYCEAEVENVEELLAHAGVQGYKLVIHEPTVMDAIMGFLMNPVVNSLLLLVIIGGIYFELQTPGIGFPLAAAVTAAVLYFAPLYLEGLAANWEILIFFVGIILLGIEIFVIPGFGVAGASGIILIISGLTLSLLNNNNFDFSFVGWEKLIFALLRVVLIISLGLIAAFAFAGKLFSSSAMRRIVLTDTMESTTGFTESLSKHKELVQQTGMAVTDLRPSGTVNLGGEQYDAIAEGGYVQKGDNIRVTEIRGNYLVVRKIEAV